MPDERPSKPLDITDKPQSNLFSQEELYTPRPPATLVRKAPQSLVPLSRSGERAQTYVGKKLWNALLSYANTQREPGSKYPGPFVAPLSQVKDDINYNSKNTAHLKELLRSMVGQAVEWTSPVKGGPSGEDEWGISTLLAAAEIVKRGRTSYLQWYYAPPMLQRLLDPRYYAKVSIAEQNSLSTAHALSLHEICSLYVDNPGGLTTKWRWQWWASALLEKPEEMIPERYQQWGRFRQDVLDPAIRDINENSEKIGWSLEMVIGNLGRTVSTLQFRIHKASQVRIPKAIGTTDALHLVGRMVAVGIHQDQATGLTETEDLLLLEEAIERLEDRIRNTRLGAIKSPLSYLDSVVSKLRDEGFSPDKATTVGAKKEVKRAAIDTTLRQVTERFLDGRKSEAFALFDEMTDQERQTILFGFRAHLESEFPAMLPAFDSRNLEAPGINSLFKIFLCSHFFGPEWSKPSAEELLHFSLGNN